jgi:hypothetical protein
VEAAQTSRPKFIERDYDGETRHADLKVFTSDGVPLRTDQSHLFVRAATAEETIIFGRAAEVAKPSDDLLLAYLASRCAI